SGTRSPIGASAPTPTATAASVASRARGCSSIWPPTTASISCDRPTSGTRTRTGWRRPQRASAPSPGRATSSRSSAVRRPGTSGGRSLARRQREAHDGAAAEFALDRELAAVSEDEVLDDGQAEAGAAELAGARLVDAIEPLGQARQVRRRNAN